jgi:hypothetical protein
MPRLPNLMEKRTLLGRKRVVNRIEKNKQENNESNKQEKEEQTKNGRKKEKKAEKEKERRKREERACASNLAAYAVS